MIEKGEDIKFYILTFSILMGNPTTFHLQCHNTFRLYNLLILITKKLRGGTKGWTGPLFRGTVALRPLVPRHCVVAKCRVGTVISRRKLARRDVSRLVDHNILFPYKHTEATPRKP